MLLLFYSPTSDASSDARDSNYDEIPLFIPGYPLTLPFCFAPAVLLFKHSLRFFIRGRNIFLASDPLTSQISLACLSYGSAGMTSEHGSGREEDKKRESGVYSSLLLQTLTSRLTHSHACKDRCKVNTTEAAVN
jgi:hypothetical protein